ncbi:hypothetical protein AB0K68_51890, partial [Streptomyces sp. NPDC050698]
PLGYIPHYVITLDDGNTTSAYFGSLIYEKRNVDFQGLVNKHYDGSLLRMLMALSWGGYDERDVDVLRSVGLRYRSFMQKIEGDKRTFYEMTDEGWEECEPFHPMDGFMSVYDANPNLLKDVCDLYSSRWRDGIINLDGLN